MIHNKVYKDDEDITSRLSEFGVTKDDLMKIVHAAAGGRNATVPNDPITAGGHFAYIYGTRALRDVFLAKEWKRDREHNIESVLNPKDRTKIIFQNVDHAADPSRIPKALSAKGAASERIVDFAQQSLFPEFDKEDEEKANASVWFFCVSVQGEHVRAELSRPYSLAGGQFNGFIERIFILQNEDWSNIDITNNDDILAPEEFDVNITRK